MKLSQKIKHFRRHRRNRNINNSAEVVYITALRTELPESWENRMMFYVNPLLYEIMRAHHVSIPNNIVSSEFVSEKDEFIVSERHWNTVDTILNCPNGMPYTYTDYKLTDSKPQYVGVDIGLRPSVSAPVPNSVTVKEI